MARAADPAGVRTVGIITKCDALQDGDEEGVSGLRTLEICILRLLGLKDRPEFS